MNKSKSVAISGLCAAAVLACLALAAIPGTKWFCLLLGVIASIATVIPMIVNPKNLTFSLLVYVAGSALGLFLGTTNVVCIVPIVAFSIPFAIVKVRGETVMITANVNSEEVLEDPFDCGDDKKIVAVKVETKPKLPKIVKWILYYVLLECGIALTLGATYLFTKPVFDALVGSKVFWLALVAAQLIVYPYDVLMTGCLKATAKVLQKAIRP